MNVELSLTRAARERWTLDTGHTYTVVDCRTSLDVQGVLTIVYMLERRRFTYALTNGWELCELNARRHAP